MTTTDTARSFSVPEFTMGDRIRRARMNAGLKQQDIEDETGISRNSVTAWEHDARMPSAALLRVLANYLHVPVEWIIEGTTPTNPPTMSYPTPTLRSRMSDLSLVTSMSRPLSFAPKLGQDPFLRAESTL